MNAVNAPQAGIKIALLSALRRKERVSNIGLALGGGLDSGALLVLAHRVGVKVRPLVLDIAGVRPAADDARRAIALARSVDFEPTVITLGMEDLVAAHPRAARAFDVPFFHPLAVARFAFYERVRALGITEIITGTGADQIFAGSPHQLHRAQTDPGALFGFPRGDRLHWDRITSGKGVLGPQLFGARFSGKSVRSVEEARRFIEHAVLPRVVLPIEEAAERATGLRFCRPYLGPSMRNLAQSLPLSELVQAQRGKVILRETFSELHLAGAQRRTKSDQLFGAQVPDSLWRRGWSRFFSTHLFPNLHRLPTAVDAGLLRRLWVAYSTLPEDAPATASAERILHRLTSAAVGAEIPEFRQEKGPSHVRTGRRLR
jgi:asparagine synthetase B (glutamine-hydrolysing)